MEEIVTLTIIDNGIGGEGIAKLENGLTVFVPQTLKGEVVNAKIVKKFDTYANAHVIKIIEPSPLRIKPVCPVYFQCGGCQLQHTTYEEQLKIKYDFVNNTLKKQLKVPFEVLPVVPCSKPFGYRNKAQLPIGMQNNKVVVGFYKPETHNIVPITFCPLHDKWLDNVINAFLEFANENNVSVYNEQTKSGLLRHLVVRNLHGILTIVVVINGQELPYSDKLINIFSTKLKDYDWSMYLSVNTKQNNIILGNNILKLYGKPNYEVEISGLKIEVNPLSFFQVNDEISGLIYKTIINYVNNSETVIDAYSGAGLLTALISKNAKQVYGIEIVPEAVEDANKLMKNNNITNVTNFCGDVQTNLPKLYKTFTDLQAKDSVLVLDPPRKGCDSTVLKTVLESKPKQIIYLSCNPATLARDLAILCNDDNYKITFVQPFDMFPQTFHVETIVVMSRDA